MVFILAERGVRVPKKSRACGGLNIPQIRSRTSKGGSGRLSGLLGQIWAKRRRQADNGKLSIIKLQKIESDYYNSFQRERSLIELFLAIHPLSYHGSFKHIFQLFSLD